MEAQKKRMLPGAILRGPTYNNPSTETIPKNNGYGTIRQKQGTSCYGNDLQNVETDKSMTNIRRDLEQAYPSLHLVGRNGMHKYNNQDHAMMTAMLTVENILAGERRYDPWCVNEDAEYTEAGVSGAQDALTSERMVPRRAA